MEAHTAAAPSATAIAGGEQGTQETTQRQAAPRPIREIVERIVAKVREVRGG